LIDVSVVSSSGVGLLDNIATDAVRNASPFPAFPQGIDKQQAVFRVSISFEKK
jgi:TonB family protein